MTSIIEKMLSGGKKNEKDARAEIQDAIRARIVLTNGSKAEGDAVFNEIINANADFCNREFIRKASNLQVGSFLRIICQPEHAQAKRCQNPTQCKDRPFHPS